MKLLVFCVLIAFTGAQVTNEEITESGKAGMCPRDYVLMHPENFPNQRPKDGEKPHHHFPDLSRLQNCSLDADCNGQLKCCETFSGMNKCIQPFFEVPQDGKPGFCPRDFIMMHPKFHHFIKGHKSWPLHRFPDLSQLQRCSLDADCDGQLKCCQTFSDMKCMTPFFDKGEDQETEDVVSDSEENPEMKDEEPDMPVTEK